MVLNPGDLSTKSEIGGHAELTIGTTANLWSPFTIGKSAILLQAGNTLQPGSKGGYFTEKSPKMLLLEWCQQEKRQKPRYKVMAAGAAGMKCKVRGRRAAC